MWVSPHTLNISPQSSESSRLFLSIHVHLSVWQNPGIDVVWEGVEEVVSADWLYLSTNAVWYKQWSCGFLSVCLPEWGSHQHTTSASFNLFISSGKMARDCMRIRTQETNAGRILWSELNDGWCLLMAAVYRELVLRSNTAPFYPQRWVYQNTFTSKQRYPSRWTTRGQFWTSETVGLLLRPFWQF